MNQDSTNLAEVGLEVVDTQSRTPLLGRPSHFHSVSSQLQSMERIARAFVEKPDTILQELVNAGVVLCQADSAGISIEKEDRTDQEFYHWVATAGQYSAFLDAVLPRYPSACGVCLERGRPQVFRVGQRFFDIMGINAPLVTDGILLPWQVDETRGTIFVMAHGRTEAFDEEDSRTMQVLANFAAMAIRQQKQQKRIVEQARAAAAAAMANELAHNINNPLQSLTNVLFLAAQGHHGEDGKVVGREALGDLDKLSSLVKKLLALPLEALK
jgi:transcriptional regulator with GAF, ATPase, and Fis domain